MLVVMQWGMNGIPLAHSGDDGVGGGGYGEVCNDCTKNNNNKVIHIGALWTTA